MPSSIQTVLVIILLATISCLFAAAVEPVTDDLLPDYNLTFPTGKGVFPCLIICPGRGYHKELPLIKGLAKQATTEGYATIRFDWTFFTNQEKPSEDGSTEMEDITAILTLAKTNPKIDSTRIFIAGKSLGSLLAYATFRENSFLKGCILMTPILPSADVGEDYYPNLIYEMRPMAFILGDKDTDNCSLAELYKMLSTCARPFPVVALTGGHSFEMGYDDKDLNLKLVNDFNVKAAIDNAVYWLKSFEYPRIKK